MRAIFYTLFILGVLYIYSQINALNKGETATPFSHAPPLLTRFERKAKVATNEVAYAPITDIMAIGTPSGKLTLWNKNFEKNHKDIQIQGEAIVHLLFSNDEHWLLATNKKGVVTLWNMDSHVSVKTLERLCKVGYLTDFIEFVEVDTVAESLVFLNAKQELIYFNYETEELYFEPIIPLAS
jgi:WD40 repeat protein